MGKIKKAAALLLCAAALAGCSDTKKAPETQQVHNTLPSETSETTAFTPQKYIITCAELAYKTIHEMEAELPNTMEVTDDTMISDVLGYDMEKAEDFSVYMQMISTELFELTVIRAAEDDINGFKAMLEDRRKYLREQAAYYPSQVAAADACVVGELNGVCYLICSDKAEELEKKLMYFIMRN